MSTENENKDIGYFNRRATSYNTDRAGRYYHSRLHDSLAKIIASHRGTGALTVLDVGSGTGRLLALLSTANPSDDYVGVDPAEQMVSVAKSSYPEMRFLEATAEHLPFEDSSFDLVFTTDSFHHWHDQLQGLREIARVVKADGTVIVEDPFAVGWLRWWHWLNRQHQTRKTMEEMAGRSGLQVETWHPVVEFLGIPLLEAVVLNKQTKTTSGVVFEHASCSRQDP
jgi:ubiquinone/menaquinone biosynthesis C-methylase UbiE